MRLNPYYSGPVTDHFDGQRFYNPGEPVTDHSLHEVLRWQRASPKNAWPTKIDVQQIVPASRVDELTDHTPIDVILLSRNDYDHFDTQTSRKINARHSPLFVARLNDDVLMRRYLPNA